MTKIKGGVLIIGSLLWQNHLGYLTDENGKPKRDSKHRKIKDSIRADWRKENLDMNSKFPVQVPIRYGRYSKDGLYTMVMSSSLIDKGLLGRAYVAKFKSEAEIGYISQYLTECIASLAVAEGICHPKKDEYLKYPYCKQWGAVAYHITPKGLKKGLDNAFKMVYDFRKKITEPSGNGFDGRKCDYHDIFRIKDEKTIVDKHGRLLNFEECFDSNLNNDLDFVLCTITVPKLKEDPKKKDLITTSYPKIAELIDTTEHDSRREGRNYFINNYKHGIVTFEDENIIGNSIIINALVKNAKF